jgi:hypothetical protein
MIKKSILIITFGLMVGSANAGWLDGFGVSIGKTSASNVASISAPGELLLGGRGYSKETYFNDSVAVYLGGVLTAQETSANDTYYREQSVFNVGVQKEVTNNVFLYGGVGLGSGVTLVRDGQCVSFSQCGNDWEVVGSSESGMNMNFGGFYKIGEKYTLGLDHNTFVGATGIMVGTDF